MPVLVSASSLFVLLLLFCFFPRTLCLAQAQNQEQVQQHQEQGECVIGANGKETCGGDETHICVDELGESECASLAKKKRGGVGGLDGCIESFATMRKQCAKTCHVCDHYSEALLQEIQDSNNKERIEMKRIFSQQFPQIIEGHQRVETFKYLQDVGEYMYNTVYNDEDYASIRVACQNRHELCTFWAFGKSSTQYTNASKHHIEILAPTTPYDDCFYGNFCHSPSWRMRKEPKLHEKRMQSFLFFV